MNKNELIDLLNQSSLSDNLDTVVQLCISRIKQSKNCQISVGEFKLTADHFFKIYAGRMKNTNGVAAKTPGLPESVKSLQEAEGLVKMISAELDEDSMVIWVSLDSKIVGCIKFLSSPEALIIAENNINQ